jgi:predicted phage baseplate assembly protein
VIPAPAVDGRRVESFFQELKRYAPHYTPDLNLSDEQGVGVALMRIFAQLAEIVSVRLDQAPQKHFVAFLDHLGISLLPARPARAAVTFRLVSGFPESVAVPIGTRVTAPGKDDDIPFETTGELIAIPGVLTATYGVAPLKDTIFGPPPGFLKQESRQPSELSYKLQSLVSAKSNRLQLDDNTELEPGSFVLIGCSEKRIVQKKDEGGFVTLYEGVSQAFPAQTSVVPIRDFEVFNGIDRQEHGLYLGHNGLFTVKEEVEIRLEVAVKDGAANLQPFDLVWQFWTKDETATPEQEEHWENLSVKSDGTISLSSSGVVVLEKPKDLEIKPRKVGGNESRWIRAQLKEKLPVDRLLPEVETIKASVNTKVAATPGSLSGIEADQGFYNATPLDLKVKPDIGFLPFGTEPRAFDQFYIGSKEAFSKTEAEVTLDFGLDLQTLAGPSVVSLNAGLRSYSIGLRRRLYELDLTVAGGAWNILGSPFDIPLLPERPQGSQYFPVEDSVPSAIADKASGSIYVFVKTEDALDEEPNNRAGRLWVHFHLSTGANADWFDLDAPPSTSKKRITFNPAAVVLPSVGPAFGRVFVVGSDGKLYSRGILGTGKPQDSWSRHDAPGGPKWASSPFVIVAGPNILVYITGEDGVVYQGTLAPPSLNMVWLALTPTNGTKFTAASRPFAQTIGATANAKVFVVSSEPGVNTRKLFECDTSASVSGPFAWRDLKQPSAGISTEGGAPAPYGYLESPGKPPDSEGLHIFVRGADNRLWERLDGDISLNVPRWELRSRPVDPELRDSPVVHLEPIDATTNRIHVFSASGRNSMVRWIFETKIDGLIKANAVNLGVQFDENRASSNNGEYVSKTLGIINGTGMGQSRSIIAYDGALRLARLATALTTPLDGTSECQIVAENVGLARPDVNDIFAVHNFTPTTDTFKSDPLNLRIRDALLPNVLAFVPFDFYSRLTGMIKLSGAVPANGDYVLYSELKSGPTEFPTSEDAGSVPELSWEYWNGSGWLSLSVADGTRSLLSNGAVKIEELPKSIRPTEVAGQENFWLRARLVGGDYGRETFRLDKDTGKIVSEKSSLRPPKVRTLRISYKANPVFPEACLTFNNLDYLDQTAACQTAGSHFPPFETLEDQSLTLFFGFDKTFKTGPVRLLLDAAERNYDESKPPELEWKFRRDRQWKPLDAEDGSVALTRQGILTLNASEELTRETRFGQSLYWIKGSLRTDRVHTEVATESADKQLQSEETNGQAGFPCGETKDQTSGPCAQAQEAQAAQLSKVTAATADYPLPLLRGVFPNTVWALQGETITEEIIGSGDGEQNQTHNFQHGDVLEGEDVRVREVLSVEEREGIERELGKESVTDREDLGGTWVRWKQTGALFDCGSQDRCYEIDRATGELRFGDGEHGSIPVAGVDNIRAFSYRTGGGSVGNVAANKIEALATAVAGIESVFNPASAGGGSEKADTNAMLTIGPRRFSHLNRAVSVEDFEKLAYEASRQVAKVRCLGTTNLILSGTGKPDPCDPGQLHEAVEERGWVSLIIVPDSSDPRPCPSLELRRSVKDYLRDRAPSSVAAGERIVVRPPDYVTVGIQANIFVTTLEKAAAAETQARKTLEEFLHPVRGGPEGLGWDFGRPISKSDVFAVLERIADIDRVEELSFQFRGRTDPDRVEIGPNELLASGEHQLKIKKA